MIALPDLVVLGTDSPVFTIDLFTGELIIFFGEAYVCSRPYTETVTRFGTGFGVDGGSKCSICGGDGGVCALDRNP